MRVYFKTLGCRLNEAETGQWLRELHRRGGHWTNEATAADVMVLNTCAVTQAAVRKSRQSLRQLRRANPQARLVATGCQATLDPDLAYRLGADQVITNAAKDDLMTTVLAKARMDKLATAGRVEPSPFDWGWHRAFIKVQDGCRWRCAFCVVTLARGAERSRTLAEIVAEINGYHADGVQEAVLTGVHIGGYGRDLGLDLAVLIRRILAETEIPRLRLASLEPWDLPTDFFALFASPRLMPHLHLPLQSGADVLLRRMGRRCTTATFAALVTQARAAIPRLNLSTDIIVGYPGESAALWQQTLDFVLAIGFSQIHAFPFSPRPGTHAATLGGMVPETTRQARVAELLAIAHRLQQTALTEQVASRQAVLFEGVRRRDDGSYVSQGYTPNFCKVCTIGDQRLLPLTGQIVATDLVAIDPRHACLLGRPCGL